MWLLLVIILRSTSAIPGEVKEAGDTAGFHHKAGSTNLL